MNLVPDAFENNLYLHFLNFSVFCSRKAKFLNICINNQIAFGEKSTVLNVMKAIMEYH